VVQLNEKTRAAYLNEFHNWALSVEAGRLCNEHPPLPPAAFVVGSYNDEYKLNGKTVEWPVPSQTGGPICDVPPIPPSSKPYVPPAMPEPDNIRNVPPGDTMPVGFIFTAANGGRWQKQSSHTPFGIAYYYARVG